MSHQKKKKKKSKIFDKAMGMLHELDTWQYNVIATLSRVKDDTHHAWTSMSHHIITTDWPSPQSQ